MLFLLLLLSSFLSSALFLLLLLFVVVVVAVGVVCVVVVGSGAVGIVGVHSPNEQETTSHYNNSGNKLVHTSTNNILFLHVAATKSHLMSHPQRHASVGVDEVGQTQGSANQQ